MAFWKRRSRQFEPVSPQTRYTVTYLGNEKMTGKAGLDNTMKPVDSMYRSFKKGRAPCRMQIEIVNNGIRVEPLDAGVQTMFVNSPFFVAEGPFGNVFFPINKLSFGAADPLHSKVFCFVSRNENSQEGNWDCHAVVCESSAMAKNLTLYLVKAFQRIADSKSDPVSAAQRTKKTTVVHILRERGTLEHQLSSQKKGKMPPVSTLKVTLNVEGSYDQSGNDQYDNNRKVADILAKHRSTDFTNFEFKMVIDRVEDSKDNGNIDTSENLGTSSSDKENEAVDDNPEEMDDSGSGTREVVVTMAVNPSMSSPPESPRKSSLPGGATSSGEEDDDDGETSPQEMITTMSPPDTPGYLSKETKPPSPTLPVTSSKPATPKIMDASNKPPSPSSPKIPCTPKKDVTSSPKSAIVTTDDDDLRRKDPTLALSTKSSTFGDAPETEGVTSTDLKNESSSPSPTSSPTSISPTPEATTESAKSAVKKVKRATRKSVRFADDDELID